MKKSSKAGPEESEIKNAALIQQFKDLKKDWESLKKCNQRNSRRCSTGSDFISLDQLLQNSPIGLMHSLQNRVKNCDMEVEEILRERKAAIMSGRVRGRRLFRANNEVEYLDLNYDDGGNDWLSMIADQREVVNEDCYSRGEQELSDAFLMSCEEDKEVVEEEKTVVVVEKGRHRCGRGGGSCVVAMAWLGFLLVLLVIGLISMGCNGNSVHEKEFILVPT